MERLKMQTPNMADENFKKLQELFPEAVTEVEENGQIVRAIDKDVLQQLISNEVVEGPKERYQFTWPGKNKSIVLAHSPINKTLRPIKGENPIDDAWFAKTQNLYIEGDNLDVLKCIQETYLHRIKMIYIDPPYNTGKNYIYRNDYKVSEDEFLRQSGLKNEEGNLVVNPKTYGRYHSEWLSMMYQRLLVARNLLSEDGVLVCAIDENEFSNLSNIMKEIFFETSYEHSYVSVVHNPRGQQGNNFSYVNEYLIIIYPSDGKKYLADFPKEEVDSRNLRDSGTESDRTDARMCFYPFYVKNGKIVGIGNVPDNSFHPKNANIKLNDGTIEIWPLTDNGDEKKWRYARQSVEKILEKLEAKTGRNNIQIIYNKDEGTIRSVWSNARYDASEYGTKLLDKLIEGCSFTFPKSLYAVYDCVKAVTKCDKEAYVMDFFSGSATTAHAVMQLNAEDGGNRKFIMVQIPEPCDEKLEAYKAGYKTICDIGKERIRRAGKKILEELKKMRPQNASGIAGGAGEQSETEGVLFDDDCKERPLSALRATSPKSFALGADQNSQLDIGFRVLRLDSSNMKDVFYRPRDLKQDNVLFQASNIKEDRTDLDLLFQVMPELGADYSSRIDEVLITGKKVLKVEQNYIVACFDDKTNEEVIKEIAKLKPVHAVFKDESFSNDSLMANLEQIFRLESPESELEII